MGLFGKTEDSNTFFVQLNELATLMLAAIVHLEHTLSDLNSNEHKEKIREILHRVRETHNIILDDLHNSFITPIDREDIFNICHSFREMSRYAYSTVHEMLNFNVAADEHIEKMIKNIRKQAEELHVATQRLEKNPRVATDHLNKIRDYEEEVEKTYRRAILSLFENVKPEELPAVFLKREVYRHISNMSDKAIAAAKVMGMIVMKLS